MAKLGMPRPAARKSAAQPAAKPAKKPAAAPAKALAARAGKASATASKLPLEREAAQRVLPKGFKMPKTMGAVADLLYTVREERLALNKVIDEKEAVEGALKDFIIDNLPKSNASGIAGKIARVSVTRKDVPKASDWSKLYRAIVIDYQRHAKKGDGLEDTAFAFLNRALAKTAIEEQWKLKRSVPGVEAFSATVVSINKV